jgi:O-antigen ligase
MGTSPTLGRFENPMRFSLVVLSGAFLALIAYKLWSLEPQHLVVVVAGVTLMCFSMAFLRRFSDFLLASLLCSIPLASFTKTFFFTNWDYESRFKAAMRFSGVVAISVPDILIAGLYFMWGVNIFVLRTRSFPRPAKYDLLPFLLVAAYLLSIPGSPTPKAAIFGTFFLARNVLLYFYVSRNVERRHLPWILAACSLAILPETGLAAFQYLTGKWLSLAWSRGVGEGLDTQYVVPGIEHISRATGTTFDSHSFGLYMAMLAPFPFAAAFARSTPSRYRVLLAGAFILAAMAIVLSFSRSAWLSAAISLTVCWGIHLLWGERRVLAPTAVIALILFTLAPWYAPLIAERFTSAGSEILTSRFDQFPIAWRIWKDHFLFGYGVGNYMEALETYNTQGVLELPVHNALLWVAAESGLFGVVAFFGVAFAALARAGKSIRRHREPSSTVAIALFSAIIAYLLDGLTDPLFREPVVYTMYWISVALTVAVARIEVSSARPEPNRA